MNRQRFLPHALVVLTLARFCLLPATDLSPVEAHAALCSEQTQLWHPMTGPILPLLMRCSAGILGASPFGLRFFAPLLILGAGWLVWQLARGLFDVTVAAWATALFQAAPVVNLASVTFTNTTLAIVEGAALLLLLRLALHKPLPFQLHWWMVSAMTLVAFFTDWRLILFVVAGTGSLFLTRRGRAAMMKWPVLPILAGPLAVALMFFFAWNSERGWVAFHFPPEGSSVAASLWYSGLLAYGPPLALLLGWALLDATLQRPLFYAPAFLLAFAWPLISLDLFALHSTPWPQAGFAAWLPSAVILTAARLLLTERIAMRVKVWIRSLVIIAAAIQSCIVLQPSMLRACGISWSFASSILPPNPSLDVTGWRETAAEVRAALESHHIDPAQVFLVTERWDLAQPIAIWLRDLPWVRPTPSHPIVHVLPDENGGRAFASWPSFASGEDSGAYLAATAIFITDLDSRDDPPKSLRDKWPNSRVIADFALVRRGQPLRTIKVFACSPAPAADKSNPKK